MRGEAGALGVPIALLAGIDGDLFENLPGGWLFSEEFDWGANASDRRFLVAVPLLYLRIRWIFSVGLKLGRHIPADCLQSKSRAPTVLAKQYHSIFLD